MGIGNSEAKVFIHNFLTYLLAAGPHRCGLIGGRHLLAALAFFIICVGAFGEDSDVPIRYERIVLDNGLTVIVHEDHKVPIVAINVWYHVGSKNEKPGKTGLAHLFEHFMFSGSQNFRGTFLDALQDVGATDIGGNTDFDRTEFFEDVPRSALDHALWMESDRMGHLFNVLDDKNLATQRGVVENEKRQDENQPYGTAHQIIAENSYPNGHPYSWTRIGSMQDLSGLTINDIKEWAAAYYRPSNAVLVLAGDIDLGTAAEKVRKYFSDIPPGPAISAQREWIAKIAGNHLTSLQDHVPHDRVYAVWNIPGYGSAEGDYLKLVALCLGQSNLSRLYKRLVQGNEIASDVQAVVEEHEIGSQFIITADARPGQSLAALEDQIEDELRRFVKSGPGSQELMQAKTEYLGRFLRAIDRIGAPGGKSDVLAQGQVFSGDPGAYNIQLHRIQSATVQQLQGAARGWLSDGVYVLEVRALPKYKAAMESADRSKPPSPGLLPQVKLPALERGTLSNGLHIIVVQRHEIPVVDFNLELDAGFAADQAAAPGTARLVTALLDGGTVARTASQISEEQASLGAHMLARSDLDTTDIWLSALKQNLDRSLDLYADIILHPTFQEAEFQRRRKEQLSTIQTEEATPLPLALRLLPPLLYGARHAYGEPFTGSGTKASISKLSRIDLVSFHEKWFRPNHSTLIVVGDTTLSEIEPAIQRCFGAWKPGNPPVKDIRIAERASTPRMYVVDRPGATQSVVVAGELVSPQNDRDKIAAETMNNLLGGTFGGRINLDLREEKHWSFGAASRLLDARGQGMFVVIAPVQSDKTADTVVEIEALLRAVLRDKPPTADELRKAQNRETMSLAGSLETIDDLIDALKKQVRFGLPDDYYEKYIDRVRALQLPDIEAAANHVIQPDNLTWIIVGDRAKIEAKLRDTRLSEIQFLNTDGTLLPSKR